MSLRNEQVLSNAVNVNEFQASILRKNVYAALSRLLQFLHLLDHPASFHYRFFIDLLVTLVFRRYLVAQQRVAEKELF